MLGRRVEASRAGTMPRTRLLNGPDLDTKRYLLLRISRQSSYPWGGAVATPDPEKAVEWPSHTLLESQEIPQESLAVLRKERLGMELHTPNGPIAVADRLNLLDSVLFSTPCHRNQAVGER